MISIDQAFELIRENVKPLSSETVQLIDAVGRILTERVCADVDSPPYDKSVMDGFAVKSKDVNAGIREFEVLETIGAGAWPQKEVNSGYASRIMTGAPMPIGADAVVVIEATELRESTGTKTVKINIESLAPGKNTMPRATNMCTGQPVFHVGHQIRPNDVGLLAESGAATVQVSAKPRIAILPTGDELVDCHEKPSNAQIRNSNGPLLGAMARSLGLQVTNLGIARDNEHELERLVSRGLENDLLILTGGVSMGQFDLVPGILSKAGVEQVFHKVAIKPGKPIWFGVLRKSEHCKYVFGLPGNPVSSLVGFHLFVRTAVRLMTGAIPGEPSSVMAELSRDHEARGDRPTYWPSRFVVDGLPQRKIEPLIWHGSSDLMALGQADSLTYFEAGTKTHRAGEFVRVFPFV